MAAAMKRCVIWAGSPVSRRMLDLLRPDDYILAADGGWKSAEALGIKPDWVLGDFDSSPRPAGENVTVLPAEKDDTDTHYATRVALERGFSSILYLGALGGKRLDHTLAALQTALYAAKQGAEVTLADENCEIRMLLGGQSVRLEPRPGWYLSLLAMGGPVEGVYERGVKYPLENASLVPDFPIGVSNEFTDQPAEIGIGSGSALLLMVRSDHI